MGERIIRKIEEIERKKEGSDFLREQKKRGNAKNSGKGDIEKRYNKKRGKTEIQKRRKKEQI